MVSYFRFCHPNCFADGDKFAMQLQDPNWLSNKIPTVQLGGAMSRQVQHIFEVSSVDFKNLCSLALWNWDILRSLEEKRVDDALMSSSENLGCWKPSSNALQKLSEAEIASLHELSQKGFLLNYTTSYQLQVGAMIFRTTKDSESRPKMSTGIKCKFEHGFYYGHILEIVKWKPLDTLPADVVCRVRWYKNSISPSSPVSGNMKLNINLKNILPRVTKYNISHRERVTWVSAQSIQQQHFMFLQSSGSTESSSSSSHIHAVSYEVHDWISSE